MAFSIFFTISSYFEGKYLISTGNIRPETLRVFCLKYFSNNEIYIEADVIITLKPFLFCNNSLTRPKITSILIVLSWASSITKHEYASRVGDSTSSSKTNLSSLKMILAFGLEVLELEATWSTNCPSFSYNSSATLSERLRVAILRGWVTRTGRAFGFSKSL